MTRLAISSSRFLAALLVVAACKGKGKPPVTAGDTEPPLVPKRMSVSWGIQPKGNSSDVFLATTDERGHQVSHPVGTYEGTCQPITPAPEMNALIAVACTLGGVGTQIQAIVRRDSEILIMKLQTVEGVAPDPMAREEVTQITAPPGAKIEVGQ